MRKISMVRKFMYIAPFLLFWACAEKENVDPWVKITSPKDDALLHQGNLVPIKAIADDEDGSITDVTIYIDGEEVGSSDQTTFIYWWNTEEYEPGSYVLRATAVDDQGAQAGVYIDVRLGAAGGLNPDLEYDTVTDVDGNAYATIGIGSQVWMAENLRVTHYPDGSPITEITDGDQWTSMAPGTQAYCWYDNQSQYGDTYGALYSWAAAVNGATGTDSIGVQGVCPDGWHLPSDSEWKELEMALGMSQAGADGLDWRGSDEGGQVKEAGYTKWSVPNEGASNSSGFTAVPGGFRSMKGGFYNLEINSTFWTATAVDGTSNSSYRTLNYEEARIYRHYNNQKLGLSVRCIKDL